MKSIVILDPLILNYIPFFECGAIPYLVKLKEIFVFDASPQSVDYYVILCVCGINVNKYFFVSRISLWVGRHCLRL